jgi:hypothetical protein
MLTAHALCRNLQLLSEGEEHLRRRDLARAQRRELVAEHALRDTIPRRVLVPIERDSQLHTGQ